MKYLRRTIRNVGGALSAFLFVCTLLLWVRSSWYFDTWHGVRLVDHDTNLVDWDLRLGPFHGISIFSEWSLHRDPIVLGDGLVEYVEFPAYKRREADTFPPGLLFDDPGLMGFAYKREQRVLNDKSPLGSFVVAVPYWFISLAFALCPLWLAFKSFQQPRKGHCSSCGYDLRATPERCPECGMPSKAATK